MSVAKSQPEPLKHAAPKINQYEYFQMYFLCILVYFLRKYMSYIKIFHLSMMLISVSLE